MEKGGKVAGMLAQKDGVGALGPGQGWTAARKRQAWQRRRLGFDLEKGWAWIFVAFNPGTSRAWAGRSAGQGGYAALEAVSQGLMAMKSVVACPGLLARPA